ncbi:MAG: hypothetical protein ACOH1X_02990 [Kaistella sp.]
MSEEKPKVDPKMVIRTEPITIKQNGGIGSESGGTIKTKVDIERIIKRKSD